jgi:hypothetical protein
MLNAPENAAPAMSALLAGLAVSGALLSQRATAGEWFLMSRHGECAPIAALKRKIPDLGDIRDPRAFAEFMRQKGFQVTSSPIAVPRGRAEAVDVPAKSLALMFVTADGCGATRKP